MQNSPYNIKKVFLMGGSAGAVMTHNVAKYLLNNPKTIEKDVLAGIVIADGISSDLISSSKDDAPSIVKKCCEHLKYDIDKLKVKSLANLYRLPPKYYTADNIAGVGKRSWTLPTLILYSKDDPYGPDEYKLKFANALKEKESSKGIIKIKASGTGHQPWGQGQLDIVKFINFLTNNKRKFK
jgi:pimeloyl-ACP methyl ester carboxylesterase